MEAETDRPLPEADLDRVLTVVGEADWQKLAGKRLFMTGGTGFVGKWLLASLLEARKRLSLGCAITVLSRRPESFLKAMPRLAPGAAGGLDFLRGDVRDFEFPADRYDVVVHAATDVMVQSPPEVIFETCFNGTRRVLDFAQRSQVKDFLLISSGAVYGAQPSAVEFMDESYCGAPDPLRSASAYGEGKRVSEWLACTRAESLTMNVKIARCFAFVGPYLPLDGHFAIGNFMRDALAGREIVIQGDGTPCRSYLHASEMAAWLWRILVRGSSGRAYNVGGTEALSMSELAARIARVSGRQLPIRTLKPKVAGAEVQRYVPHVGRARMELALPAPIPLDEAIERTIRWYRGH